MIEIKNLTVGYGDEPILSRLNFIARDGEITTILGKNGIGKTTLFRCISETIKYSGEILVSGEGELCKRLSFLQQNLPAPHIQVSTLVSFGRNPYLGLSKRLSKADKEIIASSMEKAGISHLSEKFVDEISGGEKQKAYIAMILAQQTQNIILDEPMAHLDAKSSMEIYEVLRNVSKEKTVVIISHDIISALKNSQKISVLDQKKMVFSGDSDECINSGIIKKVFDTEIVVFKKENNKYYSFK